MDLASIHQISEIIASLAIVGSLIFVGLQLRQNTSALQSTIATDYAVHWSATSLMAADSTHFAPDYVAVSTATRVDEVSPEAITRVAAFMTTVFKGCEFAYYRYLDGQLDEELWQASQNGALENFNIPFVLNHIWPMLRNQFTPQFLQFINDAIARGEHRKLVATP